jgi:hypothetical protein
MTEALRIVAVGDLSFNGGYARLARNPLRHVLARWSEADLRLGNLESPLTDAPRNRMGKLALRGCERAAAFLREADFDALGLANNHAMDYGAYGLAETCARLDAARIPHHGAGPDGSAARRPLVLERAGQSIGLLAYCCVPQTSPLYATLDQPGIAALDIERCVEDIRRLRREVDWLIVQAHWGEELSVLPTPSQRLWARRFVEAGADLILGHHPHVWQPLEWIDGVPVFHSLGNCLFSGMFWRGRGRDGTPFVSQYRLHPLSRHTGWAEVCLQRGRPTVASFRPARLRRNLELYPEETPRREAEWDRLCRRLEVSDLNAAFKEEQEETRLRRVWQDAWRPWPRRLALHLFHHGLLPGAVEGT